MGITQNRNWPTPDPTRNISLDVFALIDALTAADLDVHALFQALANKSDTDHTHQIAGINGLTAALAGKLSATFHDTLGGLSNVADNADTAPSGSIMFKGPGNSWIVGNAIEIVGAHTHVIGQVDGLQAELNSKISANGLGATMLTYATKGTLVDNDAVLGVDSEASGAPKRFTLSAIWAYIKTKADATYSAINHTHAWAAITGKPTTLAGFGITDAAPSNHTHGWAAITGKPVEFISTAAPTNVQGVDGDKWFQVI